MSLARAGTRAASQLLGTAARRAEMGATRAMSSGHSVEQEIAECKKWRTVSMIVAPGCVVLSAYFLSLPHEHHEKPPEYSYLHIRNKGFPWGPCGLFESNCEE
jgi:cytochrome c oxidase subunit 6a|mmetsp:Transcript_4016/g.7358  ORF Transcript_4016/g.7358 Transcript_4016/m.7358 type:complete len:103 (-) Transcript_4016:195-503(-)|eukprot:CAMPEP_0177762766 /NCGR_PEP_ID=MMETSP0491_2-20121128/6518_1 /TAXON_ID=63592 /ORGANISM="Tetraselmis chuii, Strain PLY429" /LENGTH=102 /DNA_ID=CAMNT_0019278839 /DNA_START=101 /DNA_END=409 /DNA_ORIENTATION=+